MHVNKIYFRNVIGSINARKGFLPPIAICVVKCYIIYADIALVYISFITTYKTHKKTFNSRNKIPIPVPLHTGLGATNAILG